MTVNYSKLSFDDLPDLPPSVVVLRTNGRAEFGWFEPRDNTFYSEATGQPIIDAIGSVDWDGEIMH